VINQAEEPIDKVVPGPRFVVEAALNEGAVQSSKWHESCPRDAGSSSSMQTARRQIDGVGRERTDLCLILTPSGATA
jgi:hypothetical protein